MLGKAVARVAKPIAQKIDKVFGTDLENCSGCKKRELWLDGVSDKIFSLWKGGDNMKYVVINQYVIEEAKDSEDAIAQAKVMKPTSVSARPLDVVAAAAANKQGAETPVKLQ